MKPKEANRNVKKQPGAGRAAVRKDWYDPMNVPLIVNRYL